MVEVLLQVPGVDVHWTDEDGSTALMRASSRGHTTVVQALLTNDRADVNAHELVTAPLFAVSDCPALTYADDCLRGLQNGRTALMWASLHGHAHVLGALLTHT